jgi:endonuclease YncB( thermonuclease family)
MNHNEFSMFQRIIFVRSFNKHSLLIGLLLICGLMPLSVHADLVGMVVKVSDGDTITVLDIENVQYKVRLTGIDAPERGQPFGTASSEHLAKLIAGKKVSVESTNYDRYGRVLGKVMLDGIDINLAQVQAGMAWWYRYYAKSQPKIDQRLYEDSENSAKRERIGLWLEPNPINPYDWRKGRR